MLESPEDILYALETAGEPIDFCCGQIRAICLTDLYTNFASGEDTYFQDYIFLISEVDYNLYELSEDNEFTYLPPNSKRLYSFKINSFMFDLTGWVNLHCSYLGITNQD